MAGLLLLSLLWAAGMVRGDLLDSPSSPLPLREGQALTFALLAAASLGVVGLNLLVRRGPRLSSKQVCAAVAIGLGLFVVPGMLTEWAGDWISPFSRTALFTLVPVFSVVFEPYIGGFGPPVPASVQVRGALPATMVGVAGSFCVFPVPLPRSAAGGWALAALVVAAASIAAGNCLAVAEAQALPRSLGGQLVSVAALAAAAGFALLSGATGPPVFAWDALGPALLWSAAVDVPGLLVLFWLMRRMSPARMGTRFVLAPLFAIFFGALLLRSAGTIRPAAWLGLILMAGSAAWLLFAPAAAGGDATILQLDSEPAQDAESARGSVPVPGKTRRLD